MKRSSILSAIALSALFGSVCANAQLTGSVAVEGEYEPIVVDAERIPSYPLTYRYELPTPELDYEYAGVVTDFKPGLFTMGVTGRQTDFPWKHRHGFVDFRLGSYLNSGLDAAIFLVADSVQSLQTDLKFRSSSLFRPASDAISKLPYRRLYDGSLGLKYSRIIGSEGLLDAGVSYRLGYFNYYATPASRSQTLNSFNINAGFSSSPSTIRGWNAALAINYLAYRRLYAPIGAASQRGDRETDVTLKGGYAFPLNELSAFAVDGEANLLFYPDQYPDVLGVPDSGRDNFGVIALRPAYRFANPQITLNAGLDVAFSYNAMGSSPSKGFNAVHVAPDVTLAYNSNAGVALYLHATGGVTPLSLAARERFDLYQTPWLLSSTPLYSPIDAKIGVNVGPFYGFSASLSFRYAIARNVPVGGWYPALLGVALSQPLPAVSITASDPYSLAYNLKGYSVALDLRYAYGSRVEVALSGNFTPQNDSHGIFNGFDRPRWIAAASVAVKPISKLKVEAGVDYRGVRKCWLLPAPGADPVAYRLRDLTNLHAKVAYSVLSNLDLYICGSNLLNRRNVDLLPGLPLEGIAIQGGLYFEF